MLKRREMACLNLCTTNLQIAQIVHTPATHSRELIHSRGVFRQTKARTKCRFNPIFMKMDCNSTRANRFRLGKKRVEELSEAKWAEKVNREGIKGEILVVKQEVLN